MTHITYRTEKGEALTFEELDNNFKGIDARLKALEVKDPAPEVLYLPLTVEQEDCEAVFKDQNDNVVGRIRLPVMHIAAKGVWKENTPYCVHDWVVKDQCTYACIQSHTSADFNQEMSTCWRLVIKGQGCETSQEIDTHKKENREGQ